MKKLLALTLVLGIASLASAGLDLATVPGLSYAVAGNTLTISGTGVSAYMFNLEADNGSDLSGAVVAAGFTGLNDPGYKLGSMWTTASAGNTAAVAAGTIFSINFTPGTQKISFVYSPVAGDPFITINGQDTMLGGYEMVIPEPMTMTLLGLGGLFLARRK